MGVRERQGLLLSVVEDDLKPAGAAADKLSSVALSPALYEADLYCEARSEEHTSELQSR